MKKKIHINQHKIKENQKHGTRYPVITCKTYKDNIYADKVTILDENGNEACKIIYRPDKPLSCGARVWIETDNECEYE